MFPNSSFSATIPTTLSVSDCIVAGSDSEIFVSYFIIFVLLFLPLCSFILYRGFLQWRQQRSTSSASLMSHSDSFTYQVMIMELINVAGSTVICCGIYRYNPVVVMVGHSLSCLTWYGETLFHILTCVERYLAVVRPVTYLSLRGERGLRIRNICIACIWLLSILATILTIFVEFISLLVDFSLLILSFFITCFCSFSVLCVLIRPGPGEQGRVGDRVAKSKQRAFYTIVVIMGALLIRCIWNLIWVVFYLAGNSGGCAVMSYEVWFNLPSCLVLPLLFLQRAGLFGCFKKTSKSGKISK